VRLLLPLRIRDFRLLWTGMTASLLGDGIFLVALAWQVYELSNAPTALAVVGVAMTVPQVALLLVGGVISDRFDRRHVMIGADVVRGLAVTALGMLAVTGSLRLWRGNGVLRPCLRRHRPGPGAGRASGPGQLT